MEKKPILKIFLSGWWKPMKSESILKKYSKKLRETQEGWAYILEKFLIGWGELKKGDP